MAAIEGQESPPLTVRISGELFVPDICAPRPVFIMVLLAELLVLVYTLANSSLPNFDWELLALCSLFKQWVVLLCAATICLLRSAFTRLSLMVTAACCLAVIALVTAVSSYLVTVAVADFSPVGSAYWWVFRNVLVAWVLGALVLRYFYLQQQITLRERAELQARLDSLRARIRPHFLFNTMNSIASLIDARPRDAEHAVEDLAELFRASLNDRDSEHTVGDELRLCEVYLGIEKLRLGERLQCEWQVDEAARSLPMPSLLLQPLVENAVYHGIAPRAEGGVIRVAVALREQRIAVEVTNPIPERGGHSDGHHMALSNIEQRLQALYGTQGLLQSEATEAAYRITLSYPVTP